MPAVKHLIASLAIAIPLAVSALAVAKGGGDGHSSSGRSGGGHSSAGSPSGGGHTGTGHTGTSHSHTTGSPHSRPATNVPRDSHGRIQRSAAVRHDFQKVHPCPSTGRTSGACPGYVVDHVTPLKRGGADRPSNMQWQTTKAANDKDKVE
jgi:hypothetical protein